MAGPICVISGVGPGTGTALVRRFAAGGYRIAMLARNAERLADLAGQVPLAKAYVCDVSDQSQVDAAMALVEREMGAPSVLVHNAVGGGWERSWKSTRPCSIAISKSTQWACSISRGGSRRPW